MKVFTGRIHCLDGVGPWGKLEKVDWTTLPIKTVKLSDLIATTNHIYIDRLQDVYFVARPEPFIRVLGLGDSQYLIDGHHRVLRAALDGITMLSARYLKDWTELPND